MMVELDIQQVISVLKDNVLTLLLGTVVSWLVGKNMETLVKSCKEIDNYILKKFKPEKWTIMQLEKSMIVDKSSTVYIKEFWNTTKKYVYDIVMGIIGIPSLLLVCANAIIFFYDFYNSNKNEPIKWLIVEILLICLLSIAFWTNILLENKAGRFVIFVFCEGTLLLLWNPCVADKWNIYIIVIGLTLLLTVIVTVLANILIIKCEYVNRKLVISRLSKYSFIVPIVCYDALKGMKNYEKIWWVWIIWTIFEYFITLIVSTTENELLLHIQIDNVDDCISVNRISEWGNKIIYISKEKEVILIDKKYFRYASYRKEFKDKKSKTKIICVFINGNKYRFDEFHIHKNGYAHFVDYTKKEVYVVQYDNILKIYKDK